MLLIDHKSFIRNTRILTNILLINEINLNQKKIKANLYDIRQDLDMMDFLIEKEYSDRLTSYMPELKAFVLSLEKHTM